MAYTEKQIEKFATFYEFKYVNGVKTPYVSTTEALGAVTADKRYEGQEFKIKNGSAVDTWQFVGGIADANLTLKITANITQNISPLNNFSQTIM